MKKVLLFLTVCSIIAWLYGCMEADAKEYEQKYLQQKSITDSLQSAVDKLNDSIEQLYQVSANKIDSLKMENNQQSLVISQLSLENKQLQDSLGNADKLWETKFWITIKEIQIGVDSLVARIRRQ